MIKMYKNEIALKKQKGMTLVVAMIMLLVITGVGVSAVKLTSTDTMAAGNSVLDMLAFQAAESTLIKTASFNDLYDIDKAATGTVRIVDKSALPDESIVGGKGVLKSAASVTVVDDIDDLCPIASGVINGVGFGCFIFEKEATSKTLGASANHIEGVAIIKPGN